MGAARGHRTLTVAPALTLTPTLTLALTPKVLPEDIAAAAENGNEEVVISWLEGGGHIDAAHPQASCTLLMCTSAEGREPLVAELLRRGADPDRSVDAGGYTYAATQG